MESHWKRKKRHFYRSSKLYKILASKLIKYYGYKVWKCEIMNWYFKIMAVFFLFIWKRKYWEYKMSDEVFFRLNCIFLPKKWQTNVVNRLTVSNVLQPTWFTQFKKFQMFWTLFIKVHEWSSQFSHFIQNFYKIQKTILRLFLNLKKKENLKKLVKTFDVFIISPNFFRCKFSWSYKCFFYFIWIYKFRKKMFCKNITVNPQLISLQKRKALRFLFFL